MASRRIRNGIVLGSLVVASLAVAAILDFHANQLPPSPTTTPIVESNIPEVVAEVNGKKLLKPILLATVAADAESKDRNNMVYRQALDDMISRELLAQEVAAEGITVDRADIDNAVARYHEHLGDTASYAEVLRESGETEEQVRGDFTRKLAVTRLLDEHARSQIKITEEDAKKFYDQNPKKFLAPADIHLADIVLKMPKDVSEEAFQARRAEAEKILQQLRAGKDFAAMAKAKSEDPVSAVKGGDVGVFRVGQLPIEVEMAAGELKKPGDVSGVVETEGALHILRLIETRPERIVPFEEVRETITQSLAEKGVAAAAQGYVGQLRKKAKVKIYM